MARYAGDAGPADRSPSSASWAPASRPRRARSRRALGLEPLADIDELIAAEDGPVDREIFRRRGRGAVPRDRGAGDARRARSRRRRRPRRRRGRERADSRGARELGLRLVPGRASARRGRAAPGSDRPLARDRDGVPRRFEAREPLYEERRDGDPAGGRGGGRSGGCAGSPPCARPPACGSLGGPRLRLLPAWSVGVTGATKLIAGAPGSRRFAIADRAALPRRSDRSCRPSRRGVEVDGGEASKTLAEAERTARGAGRARGPPRRRPGRVRRRRRRRPRRLLRGRLPARHSRRPGADHARRPGRLRLSGARPGWTSRPPRTTSAPTTSPPRCSPTPPRSPPCRAEELAAGFAEVVKTALIAGGSLWERVRAVGEPTPEAVAPLVFDCARTKIDVVAADERDAGLRAVLNLGHTVGHGIETAAGYGRDPARRGGRARAAGRAAALGARASFATRSRGCSPPRGLPTRMDGGDRGRAGARGDRAGQEAHRRRDRLRPRPRARRGRARAARRGG